MDGGGLGGATPIGPGAPVVGTIGRAGEVDLYRIEAEAGDALYVYTSATGGDRDVDPMVRVFDGAGTEVARDDDGGPGSQAALTYAIPATGTYYLGVSESGNGAYDPADARRGPSRLSTAGPRHISRAAGRTRPSPKGDYELTAELHLDRAMANLKQVGLALHNYESAFGELPGAAITDSGGAPLLSWRVALLPFLGRQDLYDQFRLDEPWDSAHNLALASQMPEVFAPANADGTGTGETFVQALVGPGAAFRVDVGRRLGEFSAGDGLKTTLMVAEGADPVLWTRPEDIDAGTTVDAGRFGGEGFADGFVGLFGDGAVRYVPDSASPAVLGAIATVEGGELTRAGDYTHRFPTSPAAAQALAANRLREIGLALHAYHDAFGRFPSSELRDVTGAPLLSWRVAILPFLDGGQVLYDALDLTKPWDHPDNLALLDFMPEVYQPTLREDVGRGETFVQGLVGAGAAFLPDRGRSIVEVADGASNTIMVAEAAGAVAWTRPMDIDAGMTVDAGNFGGEQFADGFLVLYFDGTVAALPVTTDRATIRRLITIAGSD
jgi:hypothetical protein